MTTEYNCIAWAADDDEAWWWPDSNNVYYWPAGVPRENKISAFIQAYGLLGYEVCDFLGLEDGYRKIAIYALNGIPTHAAKQLPSGKWSSKLGRCHDIEHDQPQGVNGPTYGDIAVIMKKAI